MLNSTTRRPRRSASHGSATRIRVGTARRGPRLAEQRLDVFGQAASVEAGGLGAEVVGIQEAGLVHALAEIEQQRVVLPAKASQRLAHVRPRRGRIPASE